MSSYKHFLPLVLFLGLVGLLFWGLGNDPKIVPSPFIGKQAPAFELPKLYKEGNVSNEDMEGKVWMLNVFASWCVSCRAEHEVLSKFIDSDNIEVVGLNYKDYGTEEYGKEVLGWLQQFGNPYDAIAVDTNGDTGINWGVYGVPETFVIDKHGVVRDKHTGPVTEESVRDRLRPLIQQLRTEG